MRCKGVGQAPRNKDGQTIVLVTHNPQVAERARRTVRMRDGRIESATKELAGVV